MITSLLTNIRTLINVRENSFLLRGKALAELPCLHNAYLIIENDLIVLESDAVEAVCR